jgi:uncharacterized pyridoxamine 5'-phosphate oxidase family protein
MIRIADEIIRFFRDQGFVIVSTVDKRGTPHSSCKGIIKISPGGKVYLLDAYLRGTYNNLRRNKRISITAVDEHKFKGYCLKGKARLVSRDKLSAQIKKDWESRITSRITQRLLKNIRDQKGHPWHPEALFPQPEYMIVVDVQEVVDLTPHNLKGDAR